MLWEKTNNFVLNQLPKCYLTCVYIQFSKQVLPEYSTRSNGHPT